MRISARACALVAALAVVLGLAAIVAASAAVLPGAAKAHPYSDPIWFPLASPAEMGCLKDNPECPPSGIQTIWSWDLQGENEPQGVFDQRVYAMGAGIVHITDKNQPCGTAQESRGNSMYIDHGNGVVSMYSHLNDFLVHDGDYVSARTAIGHMGNSGYTKCVAHPNTRFLAVAVMHHAAPTKKGGIAGDYVQVKNTFTCVDDVKAEWPQDLPGNDGSWHRWHDVPLNTPIPNTADDRPCIHTPPHTAPHPGNVALRKVSSSSLKASWDRAAHKYGVAKVEVQLQQYHRAIDAWTEVKVRDLRGSATATTFTGLGGGSYRVRVWFHNSVGWSKQSSWVQRDL